MVLVSVKKEKQWLSSRWNLTYRIGWEHICKAINSVYDYYGNPEIVIDGNIVAISNKEEILNLDEQSNVTLRGVSKIIKCPLMITFYNQLQMVDVAVPCMTDEFKEADYEKFNLSLCQYLDSIELAMYR